MYSTPTAICQENK